MLPIENENYGLLYSFQPNYLAHLIQDDNGSETGIVDMPEKQETQSNWRVFARNFFAFMKK
ncbi:MAG TPA: hypothetical protein VIE17_08750 [Methylophilaceae bacterium]|jgi:hypothetical protein